MTKFSDLGLIEPVLRAITEQGYETPTPIQTQAIPTLLENRDVLGIAQTGTGKTAAFALPILHRLTSENRRPGPTRMRALILTPTRELAVQIGNDFATYGKYLQKRRAVIFGGVGQFPQVKALIGGLDILVATPGRLLDLMRQGHASVAAVEILVLDEADRMLDMGFIHDIRQIVAQVPQKRQTLLFSATMPTTIGDLADRLLNDPVHIEVTPVASTVDRIEQKVLFVHTADKRYLLANVLGSPDVTRAIVFTRTKHGANKVSSHLEKAGFTVAAIHGNKSQGARQKALEDFRNGAVQALVATDIAARGIDIDGVSHVINFDLPNEPESYVHRIGRTARAGAEGVALSFCALDELPYLRTIEKTIRQTIPGFSDHKFHVEDIAELRSSKGGNRGGSKRGGKSSQPRDKGPTHPREASQKDRSHQERPRRGARPVNRSASADGVPSAPGQNRRNTRQTPRPKAHRHGNKARSAS